MLPKTQWRIAALKNGFQDATAYRLEFLFEVVGSAFVPAIIQWILWYAIFKVNGETSINGMTYDQMLHYTWMSLLFSQVRGGDHDFELQEMIRSGQLSQYLLRPVGIVEFVYIRGVAPKLLIALFGLALGVCFALAFGYSPLRLFGAMALALIGNIIHYQIGATLATAAFYWEEAYSVLMIKNLLVSFLSGELLPLFLFPDSMQWIWQSTPFYLYVFGPVQYATGNWSTLELIQHATYGLAWMTAGWIAIQITWRYSINRYSSLGG